jgi:F0F1-type ATP synthase epsilon subunit
MSDLDDLINMFEKAMVIGNELEYKQYYDMAISLMNKSPKEADIFAKRAIKEQEKDEQDLLKRISAEKNIAKALQKFKYRYELFLANKKKISSCRMNNCSDEKMELNKLLDKMIKEFEYLTT